MVEAGLKGFPEFFASFSVDFRKLKERRTRCLTGVKGFRV